MKVPPRWRERILILGLCVSSAANAGGVPPCARADENPDVAIAHCTAALESGDLSSAARSASLTRRGLAWFSKRELVKARDDLDAAIELSADSSWAYNSRAILRMQAGEIGPALADYDNAIRLKPDYAEALANRGNARLIAADLDGALADLDRAVGLGPKRIELALTWRGRARLAQGEFGRAGEDFTAALRVNPHYANAVSGRGYASFCAADFEEAADDFAFERSLRTDDESAIAWIISLRRAGRDAKHEIAKVIPGADAGLPAGIALFAGRVTPTQALQAGADPDPKARQARSCALEFQVGEWYLLRRDTASARRHLAVARATCNPSQPEYAAAGAELGRLGES